MTGISAVRAVNQLLLNAVVVESGALRFTPAGLPALDLKLEHESTVQEAGKPRQVKAVVKAVAFGGVAERLAMQAMGSLWHFQGFLATSGTAKQPVLHIQDFQQD